MPRLALPSGHLQFEVGRMLCQLRRARGLTQEELGQLLLVGRTTVQHWESGRRDPGTVMLVRLAHALDAPPSRLFSFFDDVRMDDDGVVLRDVH